MIREKWNRPLFVGKLMWRKTVSNFWKKIRSSGSETILLTT